MLAVLEGLRRYGLAAPLVSMRQIRGKLWERRKQGQKAPTREIETAIRRMNEVLEGSKE